VMEDIELGAAAFRAGSPAGAERLVHDPADGGDAPSALRTTAEAAVHLAGGTRRRGARNRAAHGVVGKNVTRADDHEDCTPNRNSRSIRQRHDKSKGKSEVYSTSNVKSLPATLIVLI